MTTVARPRGPLPARVYWTRRLLLVVVAFALIFGIAHLLGSGGSGGPTARPVGADASTSAPTSSTVQTPQATATRTAKGNRKARGKATRTATPTPTPTPLAVPSGPCVGSDVVATPSVQGPAYAGRSVRLTMTLTTKVSPACTWDVSAESLAVKVTSGSDRIWSSQQCVAAVPKQSVVVRKDHPVAVAMVWNGQRSDSDCTRTTAWAEPGFYHVIAASFGADPVDQQFELQSPVPRTITATPTPKSKAKKANR
jgi:hypothetical protein